MSEARRRRIAVVGGGWAGIAAAVVTIDSGADVTLFEMAGRLGGRARQLDPSGDPPRPVLDNGQHILIGAYRETLALLEKVGVDPRAAFVRLPLTLRYLDGEGLELPAGAPMVAFVRAVLARRGWSTSERLALLVTAAGWGARRYACPAEWTVSHLSRNLPHRVREDLIEPLCVAALNTPASDASAATFLRVLHDALFGGAGSADLLLPCLRLGALLPDPAERWMLEAGATICLRRRVVGFEAVADGWLVDGQHFDGVVLATSADEAARLVEPLNPSWAQKLAGLRYEPIITAYLQADSTRLPLPMQLLRPGRETHPAQFVFDLGQLGGPAGLLAFVISGARAWVDAGSAATWDAVIEQARAELGLTAGVALEPVRLIAEKRATFRCTPALLRPPVRIAPRLVAAGDYVEGPYPATLEGAVRCGLSAARTLQEELDAPAARQSSTGVCRDQAQRAGASAGKASV